MAYLRLAAKCLESPSGTGWFLRWPMVGSQLTLWIVFIKQHVFVQTPDCFYRYLAAETHSEIDKDDIQKNFEALNRHHSGNGKGIYIYRKYENEKKDGRFIKVFGYMIPLSLIFTHGVSPNDSKWLSPNK